MPGADEDAASMQLEKLREQLNELHRQVDGASNAMTEEAIQRYPSAAAA